jgi:hypothetical protein
MQLLMQAAMQQNNYVGSQTGVNQVEFFPRECGVTRSCGSDTTITFSGNRVVKGANYAHGEVQIRSGYSASTVEGQAGPFVPGNRNLLLQYHSNGFNDGKAFTFNITSPDDRTLNQLGIDITRSAEPYAIPYKGDFNTLSGGFNSGSLLAGSLLAAGISPQVIQQIMKTAESNGYVLTGAENPLRGLTAFNSSWNRSESTYNSFTGDSNHAPGTSYSSHVNGF